MSVPELGVLVVGFTAVGWITLGKLAADVDCGLTQDGDPLLQVPLDVLYVPPLLHETHGVLFAGACARSNWVLLEHTLHCDVPELNE